MAVNGKNFEISSTEIRFFRTSAKKLDGDMWQVKHYAIDGSFDSYFKVSEFNDEMINLIADSIFYNVKGYATELHLDPFSAIKLLAFGFLKAEDFTKAFEDTYIQTERKIRIGQLSLPVVVLSY